MRKGSKAEQVGSEFKILFCHKLLRSASVSNPVKAIDSSNEKRTLIILQGTANIRKIKGMFLNEAYGEFKKLLK